MPANSSTILSGLGTYTYLLITGHPSQTNSRGMWVVFVGGSTAIKNISSATDVEVNIINNEQDVEIVNKLTGSGVRYLLTNLSPL